MTRLRSAAAYQRTPGFLNRDSASTPLNHAGAGQPRASKRTRTVELLQRKAAHLPVFDISEIDVAGRQWDRTSLLPMTPTLRFVAQTCSQYTPYFSQNSRPRQVSSCGQWILAS